MGDKWKSWAIGSHGTVTPMISRFKMGDFLCVCWIAKHPLRVKTNLLSGNILVEQS